MVDLEIKPKVSDNDVWCVCQWMAGIELLHTRVQTKEEWETWRHRILEIQRVEVERLARIFFDAGREFQKKLDA